MKKGAIPVPHIIALVLGIIVVGLLAFWFFILGGRLDPKVQECQNKQLQYCSTWSGCGYENCAPLDGDWNGYAPGCLAAGVGRPTREECVIKLTGRKASGQTCVSNAECASGVCADDPDDDPDRGLICE